MNRKPDTLLIECDAFPFEFLSRLAERESWRKELHRPIYHVHKWWANRLGSVFRGILLGCALPDGADLEREFYHSHELSRWSVLDPFMGSGTTVGEAHKLGMTALGRDINPVAVEAVRTALGPMDRRALIAAFEELSNDVARPIRELYVSRDSRGRRADVLYYFWVMKVDCPRCRRSVDLFRSYIIARNALPHRKRDVQILCSGCGEVFPGLAGQRSATCPACRRTFDPTCGTAKGKYAICRSCDNEFRILDGLARRNAKPDYRLYAKLLLTAAGSKEYLPATDEDVAAYAECSQMLDQEVRAASISLPESVLTPGYNTRQAMNHGFRAWRDFFNDRQLLALGWLKRGIERLLDVDARRAMFTLFSGMLEFHNLFASYKGEGTGAVRHMFSHHILKPERTPIEANVWGTPRSSGSFSGLFRSRLLRALDYRQEPTELTGGRGNARICSAPFSGRIERDWPKGASLVQRGIYLSCGDSAVTGLPAKCVDLVVTDPPFFDNVHYSELADFFHAWRTTSQRQHESACDTTRSPDEVQDTDAAQFSRKLRGVFRECVRVLKEDGLLVFTYHHSRAAGWQSLAEAILGAGLRVVNSHPIKSEMSVAAPKAQSNDPIQLDIILICRKESQQCSQPLPAPSDAFDAARRKLSRLIQSGFRLSRNDCRVAILGQLLTTVRTADDLSAFAAQVDSEATAGIETQAAIQSKGRRQRLLF
jgi:putative DNA methylase